MRKSGITACLASPALTVSIGWERRTAATETGTMAGTMAGTMTGATISFLAATGAAIGAAAVLLTISAVLTILLQNDINKGIFTLRVSAGVRSAQSESERVSTLRLA